MAIVLILHLDIKYFSIPAILIQYMGYWAMAMSAKMFLVLMYMEIVFSMKGLLLLFVLLLLHQT